MREGGAWDSYNPWGGSGGGGSSDGFDMEGGPPKPQTGITINGTHLSPAAITGAPIMAAGLFGSGGIGSVLGPALNFAGGIMANDANQEMNSANNAFNANEAAKNRDWQAMMSNSAYQRSMADMQKAGLNPMLAFSQGGASSPAGSSASSSGAQKMENIFEPAVSSALQQRAIQAQVDQVESTVDLQKAGAEGARAKAGKDKTETEIIKKEIPGARMKGDFMEDVWKGYNRLKNSAKSWLQDNGPPHQKRKRIP